MITHSMAEPATAPTETPTKPAPETKPAPAPAAPPAIPAPDRRERRELPVIEPAEPSPFHNPCHGEFATLDMPPRCGLFRT